MMTIRLIKTTGARFASSAMIVVCALMALVVSGATPASAQDRKPNILVIMGDDIGWYNIGAYHQGIMSGKTPNLDKLAAEGMRFTD